MVENRCNRFHSASFQNRVIENLIYLSMYTSFFFGGGWRGILLCRNHKNPCHYRKCRTRKLKYQAVLKIKTKDIKNELHWNCMPASTSDHRVIYTLTSHFINYTLLLLGWTTSGLLCNGFNNILEALFQNLGSYCYYAIPKF